MARGIPGSLLLVAAAAVAAAEEPAQDALKARALKAKEEEKAHQASLEEAAAERRKALADLGVVEVATLGGEADPGRVVDIALVADGFTKDQQAAWKPIADRMAANFATRPFDAHAARIRIHRIDLISKESGYSSDEAKIDTALGGSLRAFPGGKLLQCDTKKAIDLVVAAVPEADYILVVLNTNEKFVASANSGAFVLLSTAKVHQGSLVVHEFGHHYINLVDEYVDEKQSGAGPPPEGIEQTWNATLQKNVYRTKWHHWNIPEAVYRGEKRGKPFVWEDNVRCYEGGATYPDGVYRAEELCHMQRGKGKEFCRVCTEICELGLYRFFPPILSVAPVWTLQKIALNESVDFEVVPLPMGATGPAARVAWYLDGRRVDAKKLKVIEPKPKEPGPVRHQLRVKGADFGEGTHQLTVTVALDTPRVHMDEGMLSAAYTWTVEVSAKGLAVKGPAAVPAEAGKPVAFTFVPAEKLPACASDGEWMQFGLHIADPKSQAEALKRLDGAPGMVRLTESIRLLRDGNGNVSGTALATLKSLLAEAAEAADDAGRLWPLDHFFDEMPRRVWQFTDRPAMLDGFAELCAAIKGIPQLPAARGKDADALLEDIRAIRDYNRERETREPKPPITDKKLK